MTDQHPDTGTVVLEIRPDSDIAEIVADVIAGYTLARRIGVGGYGEVWQAVGPGGLHKAVKILHGRYDGRQADVELRSLEKMKTVRHPFLLNIERIEVIDGRLIIVTELAEGSLEDRFNELRQEGQSGIPRDELLGFLRDASDALDFLYEQHGLQHLDVKPGNLLIQGNHVKLADFGLIKEVDRISESLVNGFTPLYAPPELFQGRPTQNSDQYSLAVVYQVMLTGCAPFNGRNAAQLVAQHLHSQPDLSSLAMSDRPAVARALSKSPQARFASCRQFVNALIERRTSQRHSGSSSANAASLRSPPAVPPLPDKEPSWSMAQPSVASVPQPPLRLAGQPVPLRPALFLGIGGLGGRVLMQLRERVQYELGASASLPAFPFLYIDTDRAGLVAARAENSRAALRESELFEMQLRTALEYRESAGGLLEWLSRRWLYNIPKSGLVEGIRPLGRLAFVDHQQALRARLRETMTQAFSAESLAHTQQETGLGPPAMEPAIYLVASIGGGTGGGAILDIAYLVRELLAELEIPRHSLTGVLVQPAPTDLSRYDVRTANSLSCLRELQYYAAPNCGYPGDRACSMEANPAAPFDTAMLVPVPPSGGSEGQGEVAQQVAEYLYRQSVDATGEFFESQRRRDQESRAKTGGSMDWGTFSLVAGRHREDDLLAAKCEFVCAALIRRWLSDATRGRNLPTTNTVLTAWVEKLLQRVQLDADQLIPRVAALMTREGGTLLESFARRLAEKEAGSPLGALLRHCDQELAAVSPTQDSQHPAVVRRSMLDQLDRLAREAVTTIEAEAFALFDLPGARLSLTAEALSSVTVQLDGLGQSIRAVIDGIERDIQTLRSAPEQEPCFPLVSAGSEAATDGDRDATRFAVCHRYCVLSICAHAYRHLLTTVSAIRSGALAGTDKLAAVRRALREQEKAIAVRLNPGRPVPLQASLDSWKVGEIEAAAKAVDERLHARGVSDLVTQLVDDQTSDLLWVAIRQLVIDHLRMDAANQELNAWTSGETSGLTAGLKPVLAAVGGGHRVFAVVPETDAVTTVRQELTAQFGDCVSVQTSRQGDLLLYYQATGIDPRLVVDRLAGGTSELLDTARRLHTRIDVNWDRTLD